jgi:hypothetical protein
MNVFVNYQTNGSDLERFVKPNEIITNFLYETKREDQYKIAFDSLLDALSRIRAWDGNNYHVGNLFRLAEDIKLNEDIYVGDEMKKFFLKLNEHKLATGSLTKVTHFMEDYIVPRVIYDRAPSVVGRLSRSRKFYAFGDITGKIIIMDLIRHELYQEIQVEKLSIL